MNILSGDHHDFGKDKFRAIGRHHHHYCSHRYHRRGILSGRFFAVSGLPQCTGQFDVYKTEVVIMMEKRSSAKCAALGVLILIVALSAGCIGNDQPTITGPPEPGSYIDENSLVTIQEKWREFTTDDPIKTMFNAYGISGGYSHHAKLTNGDHYLVNPDIYPSLIVGKQGIATGRQNSGLEYGYINAFYPVNTTHISDIKGKVLVIP